MDGVVPFRMERVAADVESFHFGVGDLDALLIGPLIERTLDRAGSAFLHRALSKNLCLTARTVVRANQERQ
jgi:hypothetical protein